MPIWSMRCCATLSVVVPILIKSDASLGIILAADASKFTRKAPVRLGNLAMIDYFVTDETPPPAFIEACSKYDTQVIDVSAPE